MRRRLGLICTLGIILAISGCAANVSQPVAVGPGAVESGGQKTAAERGGVKATVTLGAWTGTPGDLVSSLLPLYLVVENKSSKPVRLSFEQITILDSTRRQWRPLTPEQAQNIAMGGRVASGPLFSIGIGGGSGGVGVGVGAGIPIGGGYSGSPDILTRAFRGGEIAPSSRAEGFVYFPRLDPEITRFSLILSPMGGEDLSLDFATEKR